LLAKLFRSLDICMQSVTRNRCETHHYNIGDNEQLS